MKMKENLKPVLAEFIGTFFLVAVIVGSGIMAEKLSNGNDAIALLANTIATSAILFVIIKSFSNISGAHFNPVVSMVFLLKKELNGESFFFYVCMQVLGGLFAVVVIHYIFDLQILQISTNFRGEEKLFVSEVLATFGLLMTILFVGKTHHKDVAIAVALYIAAGYWFTSSTSFANPAVTLARVFSDTFTGIHPASVVYFIVGQIVGAVMALITFNKIHKS